MFSVLAYPVFALLGLAMGLVRGPRITAIMRDEDTSMDLRNLHLISSFAGFIGMAAVSIKAGFTVFAVCVLAPLGLSFWRAGDSDAIAGVAIHPKTTCRLTMALGLAVAAICFSGAG